MFRSIEAFRAKLESGRVCLGTSITFSDPAVTECMGKGSDFFWIDLEHSPMSLESLQAHLIAARAVNVPGLVRVPTSEVGMIKRVLDTGASGLIVPQVRSAAEVRQVVSSCRYKQLGDRGFGPRRVSSYGEYEPGEYVAEANKKLFVSVQIETVEAYRELDAILQIPCLDSIVVGPYDLAASMGHMGTVNHPEVVNAVTNIIAQARKAGLYVGMGMGVEEDYALRAAEMGVHWVQVGCDFMYLARYPAEVLENIRRRLGITS